MIVSKQQLIHDYFLRRAKLARERERLINGYCYDQVQDNAKAQRFIKRNSSMRGAI